ncbi:MAG: SapC family protein [Sandaracinobacteroides sp.]
MAAHQILNLADHRDLRIKTGAGPELGDATMACLAVPDEFRRLACEYPILFRYDTEQRSYSALALFGFEPGENLFLVDGQWDAACRPLAISVQPFLVGRPRDEGGQSQVHIDMDHPRIATDGEGMRVFDDAGQPTPFLEQAADMLGALDEGYRASGEFLAALDRHDLIEPFSMDVTLDNGAMHRLVGYHLINEEKLGALEPAVLAGLHAEGHLEPLYMALASVGNLAKLVRRKNRKTRG